jgi:hypothetical protein
VGHGEEHLVFAGATARAKRGRLGLGFRVSAV